MEYGAESGGEFGAERGGEFGAESGECKDEGAVGLCMRKIKRLNH